MCSQALSSGGPNWANPIRHICKLHIIYLKVLPESVEIRIEGPATTTIDLLEAVTTEIWSLNVETATHFLPKSEEWYRVFPDDA